jgi:phage tail sheath protein FI
MKLFQEAFSQFGFNPKLLIAPGYSTVATVAAELAVAANKYRAHCFIDAPVGTTPTGAINGRGPAGSINFNTSDKRVVLCYPHLKISNPDPRIPDTDANKNYNFPFSAFVAGVQAATDNSRGYWYSFSNKEIKGFTGVERVITASINDASTEANLLNEVGIVTQFNNFGSGLRVWGNRSAAFPSDTHPSNFVSVQRTADIIHESIELAMMPFIDEPINNALISAIVETVNGFINTLIGRGALIQGSYCYFDANNNPPTEIAAGRLTFEIVMMPPTPAERITFNSFIDINLLKNLVG